MTDSLSKPVALSMSAHVVLAVAFMLQMYFAPSQPIHIQDAVRVDIVGLPDKVQTLPEEKAPPAPENAKEKLPPKVETKEAKANSAPKVDLNKKTKANKQNEALNRIKAMAALDKIREDVSKSKAGSKVLKGNIVSEGNSLTGMSKIDYDRYYSDIGIRVNQHWALPEWLINSGLRGQVAVWIDESGGLKKKKIVKSSGNPEFDAKMMDAIDKAVPFPAPPERLKSLMAIKGIVIAFPQRGDS